MGLQRRVTWFFVGFAALLLTALLVTSALAFVREINANAADHARNIGRMVQVMLTHAMQTGTITSRGALLYRLENRIPEVTYLHVARGSWVSKQYGEGLPEERPLDPAENAALTDGVERVSNRLVDFVPRVRATMPFVARDTCLNCHNAPPGSVLGAITVEVSAGRDLRRALLLLTLPAGTIVALALGGVVVLRRLMRPLGATAHQIQRVAEQAVHGDFRRRVEVRSSGEVAAIGEAINRLLENLDRHIERIAAMASRLVGYDAAASRDRLGATAELMEGLVEASRFKRAIEEDETAEEVYHRLAHILMERFDLDRFSLYEVDEEQCRIIPVAVDGVEAAPARHCDPQILLRPEACRARRTGHTIDGFDTPGLCTMFRGGDDDGHLCLPMIQSGGVGCVVQIVLPHDRASLAAALRPFIQVYVDQAAPVLEAKRLVAAMRESSLRDPMTGLHNRRFLEEYLETLMAGVKRRETMLSILMCDLDYFKEVNDKYGHEAGDRVLVAVARALRESVRASDLVVRYGGEEFLVILVDVADREAGMRVGEKIRARVESLNIEIPGAVLRKTISVGVAECPADAEDFWRALKYADVALYRAKEEGRNRVVHFTPEMWTEEAY